MTDETVPFAEHLLDGRYRLVERIGGGAVADVFRGIDERLERPVAIKLFRGDAAEQLQRHEAEMRTLASLDHPSLVTVFDAGTTADTEQPYLVMQLIEGPTLADELREGPLTPATAARYGAELAGALAYVHDRGIVHRDVKPANVLITGDGRVHLADFGIARLVDSAHVTKTGDVLGTPAYFAPEQVAAEPVGPPADIYALGIMEIECLTGRRPFEGTALEVAMARVNRAPEIPPSIPEGWRRLLTAMTSRDPAGRPTAAQTAAALQSIAAGGDIDRTAVLPPRAAAPGPATAVMPATTVSRAPAYPPAPAARRRGPSAAVIALVVILAAAAIAAVIVVVHRDSTSGPTTAYVPGQPTLHPQRLENDMQALEKLVRR